MPRPSEVNTSDTRWRYTKAKTYEPYEEAHLQPYGSRIFLHDGLRHSTKTVQEEFRENQSGNRKRNLLRQSACGLVSGKRSGESQEAVTSSAGLTRLSRHPGPRGSAIIQRIAFRDCRWRPTPFNTSARTAR